MTSPSSVLCVYEAFGYWDYINPSTGLLICSEPVQDWGIPGISPQQSSNEKQQQPQQNKATVTHKSPLLSFHLLYSFIPSKHHSYTLITVTLGETVSLFPNCLEGVLIHLIPKPPASGFGQVTVEVRSDASTLHHSLSWSNSPHNAWRCTIFAQMNHFRWGPHGAQWEKLTGLQHCQQSRVATLKNLKCKIYFELFHSFVDWIFPYVLIVLMSFVRIYNRNSQENEGLTLNEKVCPNLIINYLMEIYF